MMKTTVKKRWTVAVSVAMLTLIAVPANEAFAQTCDKSSTKYSREMLDALYSAAESGQLETVKTLIEHQGMDVNTRLKDQQTALIICTYTGQTDVANYLLEKGADTSLKNKWNNAALHDAGLKDRVDIANMLIKAGADINQRGESGNTPLHQACREQQSNVAVFLVEKGADVNALNDRGWPPILYASWSGNAQILQALVEKGADINYTDDNGNNIVKSLAQNGRNDALEFALAKKADVNQPDGTGMLPIHFAVKFRHPETVALLLDDTRDLNAKEGNYGNTALHMAAINGDVRAAKMLLRSGVSASIRNQEGKSPLDYAVKYGHTDLVKFMLSENLATVNDLKLSEDSRQVVEEPVANGEAKVTYAGHSGWIVCTNSKVLVFDYWANNEPEQPALANGSFNPEEMQGKEVFVFVSHDHGDHFDPTIYEWAKKVSNVRYVYGFDPHQSVVNEQGYNGPEFIRIADNTTRKIGDVVVTTIKSNDTGQGFLVEADGLTLWHPGDHAWFAPEDEMIFKKELDFVAGKYNEIDIAFLPVSGCPSRWQKDYIIKGFFYSIDKLNPKTVYPMHAFQREYLLKEFAQLAEERNCPVEIATADNKGDRFLYLNRSMASK